MVVGLGWARLYVMVVLEMVALDLVMVVLMVVVLVLVDEENVKMKKKNRFYLGILISPLI